MKRAMEPLELGFYMVLSSMMWMLATELVSLARAASMRA